MKIFLPILAIVVILIISFSLFLLFIKIRLIMKFSRKTNEAFKYEVFIEAFRGLITKKIRYHEETDGDESSKSFLSKLTDKLRLKSGKDMQEPETDLSFKEKVLKYYNIFLKIKQTYLMSKHRIHKNILADKIFLNVRFGLDDAAATGIATGALWAGIYDVIAFIAGIITIREPQISVNADYDNELIELDGECIIMMRPVNIIIIICTIAINYFKVTHKLNKNKEKAAINYGNTN